MIISRTPFRISFAGGGTDLKAFYCNEGGAVISTTIDKYMYITVNKRFDNTLRVSYSKTEIVKTAQEVKHPIVREALNLAGIKTGVEITSIADIPAGTGLGSSSSFTVGLLHALYAYLGEYKAAEELAQEACRIEIDILGEPIGKQDQYAAAYGGMLYMQFNPDDSVFIDPVICKQEVRKELSDRLMMFYTGISRESRTILKKQKQRIKQKYECLKKMKDLSIQIQEILIRGRNLDEIGEILHEVWMNKRSLVACISNGQINTIYDKARDAGALGGKVLGAGGGGFLLLYCQRQNQKKVRQTLRDLKELPFGFERQGSKIIHVG